MNLFESAFALVVWLSLAYLLIDGWLRQSVWVKGASHGRWSLTELAHRRSRAQYPASFWGFMGFYAVGLVFISYMLVQDRWL